jgi:hypothetical protein
MRRNHVLSIFAFALAGSCLEAQAPTPDQVIARMLDRDRERQSSLDGYTARRRYVLENERHHKRAEMLVRVTCVKDGTKEFEIVSSDGWGIARKHVFPKLLEAETDASHPGSRERSRIIPENYTFHMAGTEMVNSRPAYVIEVTPKTSNKYLMKGKIWVDAEEYAIVRIDGQPAKNPSFWTKSVHFVHTYAKQGPFWLPQSDESVTDVRILGATDLKIEYFGYLPNDNAISLASAGERSRP